MRQLELVQETGRILAAVDNPDEAVRDLLRALAAADEWDLVRLLAFDAANDTLHADARWAAGDERAMQATAVADVPAGGGLAARVLATRETLWVEDVTTMPAGMSRADLGAGRFATIVSVPVISADQAIGILELCARRRVERTPMHVRMLDALGEQLGLVLARILLGTSPAAAASEHGVPVAGGVLADDNPFPVLRIAADGRVVAANAPARRLAGVESGRRAPRMLERAADEVRRAGRPRELELASDDRVLLVHLAPGSAPGEVLGFASDVTSRVEAERRLRESEAALTGLYRVAADPALALDEQLRRLTGLIVARFGQGSAIISRVVDGGLEVVQAKAFDPAITPGYVFTSDRAYSWEAIRRDEVVAIWDSHAQPEWRDHPATTSFGLRAYVGAPLHVGGRLWGAVSYSSPFPRPRPYRSPELDYVRLVAEWIGTALEKAEAAEALAEANRELATAVDRTARLAEAAEAASRAKGTFLATMSHEIRQPLHGLLGMVQVLETLPLDDEQRRTVALIRTSGDQLVHIVDDVLDLANLDAGSLELREQPFLPANLLAEVATEHEAAAAVKGIDLRLDVGSLPAEPVLGDPRRLRQVAAAVLGNAIKFTEAGEVAVRAWLAGGPTPALCVEVADTGIGIDAGDLERIFEPFVQADGGMQRVHQGSGLGLAIAARLAGLMGGSLDAVSTPGRGSTFTIRVPLRPASQAQAAEEAAVAGAAGPRRVLVVEDTAISREIAVRFLQRDGHEVLTAADGILALEVLAKEGVDLVLMDCQMPVLDGFTTTERIRAREAEGRLSRLPVVAVTANTFADDRARAYRAGMDDVLPKPYRAADLLEVVRRHAADPGVRAARPAAMAEDGVLVGGDPWAAPGREPAMTGPEAAPGLPAPPTPLHPTATPSHAALAGPTTGHGAPAEDDLEPALALPGARPGAMPTGLAGLAAIGIPGADLVEILDAFILDGDALVNALATQVAERDRVGVGEAANALLDSAATVGFDALVDACTSLLAADERDIARHVETVTEAYRSAASRAQTLAIRLGAA